MKSFLQSSVPLRYLTSPPMQKVQRLSKCPLDADLAYSMVKNCESNKDEVCGFITNDGGILYVPNTHKEPHFNFHMDIGDIQEALNIICKINESSVMGVFHTHPTNVPWPSPVDINGWPNPDLGWRYWIATNHEVIEWGLGR